MSNYTNNTMPRQIMSSHISDIKDSCAWHNIIVLYLGVTSDPNTINIDPMCYSFSISFDKKNPIYFWTKLNKS